MYSVSIDDNFHHGDASERVTHGNFDTLDAAIAAAEKIVEESLDHLYRPGMTAARLYSDYCDFGDDPFIASSPIRDNVFRGWRRRTGAGRRRLAMRVVPRRRALRSAARNPDSPAGSRRGSSETAA
jgi:hypothetical protein